MAGGKDLFAPASETKAEKAKGKDLFAGSAKSGMSAKATGVLQSAFPGSPNMRASLPGKQGGADSMTNREDTRIIVQAQQALAAQQEADRKARVQPVERAANTAGANAEAAMGAKFNSPVMAAAAGPSMQIAGLNAAEGVYSEGGVMSAPRAASVRGANSLALGVPAIVNEGYRSEVAQAGQDQPLAALLGDIAGYAAPGEFGFNVGKAGYNAVVKPLVNAFAPKGGSAAARTTRFATRGLEQVGAWAGQNALFQGTVGESVSAAEEGRDPSLSSALDKAGQGATDPLNVLGPAGLMALNRLGKFVSTGGRTATPDNIAAEVSAATAGKSGSGSVLDATMLGGDVDRRAETILLRMLRDAGFSRDDVSRSFAAFEQAAKGQTDLPVLTARLKDVLIENLGQGAEDVIQKFLQGAGVSKGAASGTVERAVKQDYGRLNAFLEDSANARLGSGDRNATLAGADQEMTRLGKEGYERTFNAPPANQAGVDELRKALDFYATSELSTPLKQVAAGDMLDVQQMIAADPRQAAHWMQMAAQRKAQDAFDKGDTTLGNAFTAMRKQILSRLEADGVAPGYQQTRMQFGDEFGREQAVTFGSRFFTKVEDRVGMANLETELRDLTPVQQEAALLSIRDELLKISGRHMEGAPPRLNQVGNEPSLLGLETVVGEQGGKLANDIRYINERLARLRRIDAVTGKSSTTPSAEALRMANDTVSNPVSRVVGKFLETLGGDAAVSTTVSAATGNPAALPFLSLRAGMRGLGDQLARGRQGKIDDVTGLLMRDVGPQARPPMPGDDLPPLTSTRTPPPGGSPPPGNAFGPASVSTEAPQNAFAQPTQGGPKGGKLGTRAADATAVAAVATGGPTAEADTASSEARLNELAQLEASTQQQIAEAEQGLKTFRGLSVVEKQKFLKDNGFLGENGKPLAIDGAPEGNTAFAIKAYEAQADQAISAAQAERENVRGQINDVRVMLAEQGGKTPNPALDKAMELGSYVGAAYLAHRLRGAGVAKSQATARAIEGQANSLLTRLPVPPPVPKKTMLSRVPIVGKKERARIATATRAANKAARATEERLAGRDVPPISSNPTSPNGLPTREANVNEFDRRGAAGEFGPAGPIGRFMEPLTSRVRTGDLGVMGLGAGDAYVMEGMLEKTRADIDAQEAELREARKAADPTRITAARAQLEKLQTIETVQTTFQRIGIGLFAGAALGVTHGQYAKPRPRFEAAARERALIEDFRAPRPPTPPPANAFAPSTSPKSPRTVGKTKPKPKPPVSFNGGRSRKAENDNDR